MYWESMKSKSTTLKYFLILFIVGILIRSIVSPSLNIVLFSAFGASLLAVVILLTKIKNKQQIAILFLGGIFLFLGFWRLEVFLPILDENHIANYVGQVVELEGVVVAEPDTRNNSIQYNLDVEKVEGNVLVFTSLFSEFKYGEKLSLTCRLQQPEHIDGFNYPGYLAKEKVYAICFNPLTLNSIQPPDKSWQGWLIDRKQNFKEIIDRSLNYPESTFLNSILLGQRRELPNYIQNSFTATGTSHLVAISGLHIVILSAIIFSFFRTLRISKKKSFIFVIVFLALFITMIGFKASAIRAGIFGLIAILAEVVSRPKRATLLLLWAATIILIINPLMLRYDVGFQLSFLAVLGLIYLGPVLKRKLSRLPNWLGLRSILVMTMAAQLFVLPWILYKFGTLSLISPLANLLVLPVMPIIMFLGFILLILGTIYLPLAQIIGVIVGLFIAYILAIINWLATVPYASWQFSASLWQAGIIYLLLGLAFFRPTRRLLSKLLKFKSRVKVINQDNSDIVTEIVELK